MSFSDNLNRICKEQGTTLTRVCKDLGISTSKVTAIKNGSIPNEEMMLKFAKHLACSVMDFFADDEEVIPIKHSDADEEDILRIYRTLSRRTKHEFMAMVYEFENKVDTDI
ncbi:helix-turn-helix domain-containing protein [Criibacterium bergeronii]|uniref:XRE family transcriptional regulator n=1 Tax=Criibacterium bergeronii TaxID=1871336 RepID=A0A1C0AG81_9FIRM|nr:helix-turn-helix transcriptional regulator [Criibacterium bergeronii]RDY21396.1 XRE family transcriptional regulator [Criibacterium bergeronii]